jgi:PAS domain S-box-containing protein
MLKTWAGAIRENRGFSAEYRLVARQGAVRWVSEQATSEFSGEGKLAGYVGTMEDITGRKSLEEQLVQSQKMESMGQLASGWLTTSITC